MALPTEKRLLVSTARNSSLRSCLTWVTDSPASIKIRWTIRSITSSYRETLSTISNLVRTPKCINPEWSHWQKRSISGSIKHQSSLICGSQISRNFFVDIKHCCSIDLDAEAVLGYNLPIITGYHYVRYALITFIPIGRPNLAGVIGVSRHTAVKNMISLPQIWFATTLAFVESLVLRFLPRNSPLDQDRRKQEDKSKPSQICTQFLWCEKSMKRKH